MKILLIGGFHFGSLTESYARAFEKLDHEVFRFDSDRAYFQAARWAGNKWLRRFGKRLLWNRLNLTTMEMVRSVRPQLVVAVKGTYLNPETVRRIRLTEQIPIINYYSDNPYCGIPFDPRKTSAQRRDLVEVLREYTHVFIWGKHLVKQLRTDKVSASYLPFAVDTEQYRPFPRRTCPDCTAHHKIVLVGLHNTKRELHVAAIRKEQVGIWGPGWHRAKRHLKSHHVIHESRVFGSDSAALYASADISMNVVDDLNMPGHNMRTFEIPASGGAMLATFTEEQAELFPEGEAAWYYRSPGEIDAIINRALSDQEALKKMRSTALQLAQDHTYPQRAMALLKEISK